MRAGQQRDLGEVVRTDAVPTGSLVIRGGPDRPDLILHHARRLARRFHAGGMPAFGVSAVLAAATDVASARRLLDSYEWLHVATTDALHDAGFAVWPTFRAPHVTVLLPEPSLHAARLLMVVLGPPRHNPEYQ